MSGVNSATRLHVLANLQLESIAAQVRSYTWHMRDLQVRREQVANRLPVGLHDQPHESLIPTIPEHLLRNQAWQDQRINRTHLPDETRMTDETLAERFLHLT